MREVSAQDTSASRHDGVDGSVGHLFRGVFNRSLSSIGHGFLNGSFNSNNGNTNSFMSTFGGSLNSSFANPAYTAKSVTSNGTPNSASRGSPLIISNGTSHSAFHGRANGTNNATGSITSQQSTRPSEPCLFPGCAAQTFTAAPFCAQHLTRISSKRQSGVEATEETATATSSTQSLTRKTTNFAGTGAPPDAPSDTRSGHAQLSKNSILASEPSVAYLRRKTAPNNGPYHGALSRTSTSFSTSPSAPYSSGPSISHNGAPATPSSRTEDEHLGGSYFAASHAGSEHRTTEAQQNGDGNGKDSMAISAGSILTPSESPPDLRATHEPRKRLRTEGLYEPSWQALNGSHATPEKSAPQTVQATSSTPGQAAGRALLYTTVQPGVAREPRPDVPMPDIVRSPAQTEASQTQPHPQKLPAQDGAPTHAASSSGGNAAESAADKSSPSRLGLRLSLLQRMEARDRERRKAPHSHGTVDASSKAAMTYSLDTYIYNQGSEVAPLPPSPGVAIATHEKPEAVSGAAAAMLPSAFSPTASLCPSTKPADYVYAHIDPRVHWTQARTKDWHEAKQKEITARGGRKANFGLVAKRAAAVRRRAAERLVANRSTANGISTADSSAADTNGNSNSNSNAGGGIGGHNLRHAKVSRASATTTTTATTATITTKTPALPPRQLPSVWSGELPPDVAHNKSWVSMLGMFAQDEDARQARQATKGRRNRGR